MVQRQPQNFVPADRMHVQSLTGLFNFGMLLGTRNACNDKLITINGVTGFPSSVTSAGMSLSGNVFGGANTFTTATLESGVSELVTGTDATFVWHGIVNNLTYGNVMCRGDDSNGNGTSFKLIVTAAGEAQFAYIDTSPAQFTATTSGANIAAGELVTIVGTKIGTTVSVYCKRFKASVTGGNGNLRTSGRGVSLNYAGNSSVTNHGAAANHIMAAVFRTGIPDGQARDILRNPWQLFRSNTYFPFSVATSDFVTTSGSASGSSVVTSSSNSIWNVNGSSVGLPSAGGVGRAIQNISGLSPAQSTVTSVVRAIYQSTGSSSAVSSTNSQANSIWVIVGSSSGTSSANVVATTDEENGQDDFQPTSGGSSGTSSVQVTTQTVIELIGTSLGSSSVNSNALLIQGVDGNSNSIATVQSVTQKIAQVVAEAFGSSTAIAIITDGAATSITINGKISVTVIDNNYVAILLDNKYTTSLL